MSEKTGFIYLFYLFVTPVIYPKDYKLKSPYIC